MRRRSPVIVALLLALVAGACQGGADAGEWDPDQNGSSPT